MAHKKQKPKNRRKIGRSSKSGKFVSKDQVKLDPDGTVTETVDIARGGHDYSEGCCEISKEDHCSVEEKKDRNGDGL